MTAAFADAVPVTLAGPVAVVVKPIARVRPKPLIGWLRLLEGTGSVTLPRRTRNDRAQSLDAQFLRAVYDHVHICPNPDGTLFVQL